MWIVGVALALGGCSGPDPPLAPIGDVKDRHAEEWMVIPEVTGVGIGLCDQEECIRVFLSAPSPPAERAIPDRVEGYRVDVQVGGAVRPRRTPGPGAEP